MIRSDATRSPRRIGRRYLVFSRAARMPAYNAFLALGCLVGVLAGATTPSAQAIGAARFAVVASLLLAPALVGARIWFVFMHWRFFRAHPRTVFDRRRGGSALYGGLLLAFAVSAALLPLAGVPLWDFWDAASVTMLVGLIVTRFGCLVNGCCGGRTTSRWFGVRLPDHTGRWERRIPTQLLEAGWAVFALGIALWVDGRLPFAGALFLIVVDGYAGARLLLEQTRDDATGRRANVAVSAALLVATLIVALAWWLA